MPGTTKEMPKQWPHFGTWGGCTSKLRKDEATSMYSQLGMLALVRVRSAGSILGTAEAEHS